MTFRRGRSDSDFHAEIDSHILEEIDRLIRDGLTPEDARAMALRSFGNVTSARERFYESARIRWLDDAVADVRYALRTLRRHWGFAAITILTLSLGIGATTAIFSVVNALLLKPLPYAGSDRLTRLLVNVPPGAPGQGGPRRLPGGISLTELAELETRMTTVSGIGVYGPALMTSTGDRQATRLDGMRMSPSVWRMLAVNPRIGRVFDANDDLQHAGSVVVLSHKLWQRQFRSDPNIIGQSLVLEDKIRLMLAAKDYSSRYTIVGVMPASFEFPNPDTQFWIPTPAAGPGGGAVLARLKDGVSAHAASDEVNSLLRGLRPGRPNTFEMALEGEELVGSMKQPLLVLSGAVLCVLLIACVNVTNLLLARSLVRQRELAIRTALGSGRGRLFRQFFTESLILCLLGSAAGIVLAFGGVALLKNLASTLSRMDLGNLIGFPRLSEVGIDTTVLLFALSICAGTAILFGFAPLLGRGSAGIILALKEASGTTVADSYGKWRIGKRSSLVIAEIGLAMVLLIGGGLLIRSFWKLSSVNLGYNAANVLTFQVALPGSRSSAPELRTFADAFAAEMKKIPGVQEVAYAHQLPMVALRQSANFRRSPALPDRPAPGLSSEDARLVSHEYFKVLEIQLKSGRYFNEHDRASQPRVLIINQSLARRDFPGEDPVGKTAYLGRDSEPWQVIGVVEDVRQFGFDKQPEPQVFVDFRQWPGTSPIGDVPQYFAVRTETDPLSVVADVRTMLGGLDSTAGVYNVATLQQLVSNSVSRPRMYAVLLGVFAVVSVVLAAIGVYGLVAYSVAQRTKEIGIRMSLGARRMEVVLLVLRQSLGLILSGILLGCVGGAVVGRYIRGLLFGIEPLDPPTIISVALVFAVVATAACYLPARRAVNVDPVQSLRSE